ncbi:hypothetical protein [Clostridium chrysemydis]|uniref:hypothetical protein n=1 Tax=Clostridium chrysemydis TaxID=2665504 RepID=UPI001883AFF1|nr:hypothetical protein [Clostridium chrysemydis]
MVLMHKVKSFNFEFIIDTKLDKYYDILVDDEIALYRSPINEKVYIDAKNIIEDLVTDLLLEDLGEDGIYNELVDNIEILYRKGIIPDEINYKFNRIRKASNNFAHPDAKSIDTPEYILISLRECLKWYLDHFKVGLINDYTEFEKPDHSKIEDYDERYKEILENYEKLKDKYDESIKLKESRINELKKKEESLEENLEDKKKELLEARKLIRIYGNKEKEIGKLINDVNDNITFLKNIVTDLKNTEVINSINRVVEEGNKSVIIAKEKEKSLIENISLLEDKVLEGVDLREHIEKADRVSYEIEQDIEAIKLVVRNTSKEILDLKDDKEIEELDFSRYPEFFRGFLCLKGDKLRASYILLEKLSIKELIEFMVNGKFTKKSVQKLQKFIYSETLKLVSLSDEEIKLKLYYSLMRCAKVTEGVLINEKEFKLNLDVVIEEAYGVIEKNKDFYSGEDKLEDIIFYYLNKISENINKKFKKLDAVQSEAIINRVYNGIDALSENQKEDLFKELELVEPTEATVKSTIRTLGPSNILKSLIKRESYSSYTAYSSMTYGVLKLLNENMPFNSYPGGDKFLSFLTMPYLIQSLINEGNFLIESKRKRKFQIISILILSVTLDEIINSDKEQVEKGYEDLKEAWRVLYNDYLALEDEWNEVSDNLEAIKSIEDELKAKLDIHREKIEEKRNVLKNQKAELKEVILNSDRVRLLDGYFDYDKDKDKLKKFIMAKNYNRKNGILKKLVFKAKNELRIRIVKEDIKKHEERLVELAIENTHFRFETELLRITISDIEEEKILRDKTKEEIKQYQSDYKEAIYEKKEIECRIEKIKREYFDICLE